MPQRHVDVGTYNIHAVRSYFRNEASLKRSSLKTSCPLIQVFRDFHGHMQTRRGQDMNSLQSESRDGDPTSFCSPCALRYQGEASCMQIRAYRVLGILSIVSTTSVLSAEVVHTKTCLTIETFLTSICSLVPADRKHSPVNTVFRYVCFRKHALVS